MSRSRWSTARPRKLAVDEEAWYVQLRKPDGIPDVIQQIKHGVLGLLAQHKVIGHAIPGIVESTLEEYTHLGDAASKSDGRIYSPRLGVLEVDGENSGVPDDRSAFTTHTTPLNYVASSSLAAGRGCFVGLTTRWPQSAFKQQCGYGTRSINSLPPCSSPSNTTGGGLSDQETKAAVELLLATHGGDDYRQGLKELLPVIQERFGSIGWIAVRAIPLMDAEFKSLAAAPALLQRQIR
jgi:endoglucanase